MTRSCESRAHEPTTTAAREVAWNRYSELMNDAQLFILANIAVSVGCFLLGLLILWAVIRSAVLSALRKHSDEQTPRPPQVYRD